jgi:lipopolysaccharide transport system permease protein
VANAQVFGKVYFPRLCVPLAIVISNLLQFVIQGLLFAAIFLYYLCHGVGAMAHPSGWLFLLPLVVVQMGILGLGCGILVSSLTTKYRDLSLAVTFGVQLWMYATPVIYPLKTIPEAYQTLYALNPMVGVIEFFRVALLNDGSLNLAHMFSSMGATLLILAVGLILFHWVEKSFMDTV